MPVEAVPIEFHQHGLKQAIEDINEVLQTGSYVGHIAVMGWPSRYGRENRIEGVVLLIDRPSPEAAPTQG
jgi:hypothetical protein